MTITEFLEARITEDEAYAAQAQGEHYGWIDYWRVTDTRQGTRTESVIYAHAFRFDPERTLAECAAKRVIIAECSEDHEDAMASRNDVTELASVVLYALAAAYADHPEYKAEWAL